MSAAKIKKFEFLVSRSQLDNLLRELMILECVELLPPETPLLEDLSFTESDTSEREELHGEYETLSRALKIIERHVPETRALFAARPKIAKDKLTEELDAAEQLELAKNIETLDNKLTELTAAEAAERSTIASLTPWLGLNLSLTGAGTAAAAVIFGKLPSRPGMRALDKALYETSPEVQTFTVSSRGGQRYIYVVCSRKSEQSVLDTLRRFSFTPAIFDGLDGTAHENTERCEARLKRLSDEKNEVTAWIKDAAAHRNDLRLCREQIGIFIARAEAGRGLPGTRSSALLTGWFDTSKESELVLTLSKYACAWEFFDPPSGESLQIPKSPGKSRILRAVLSLFLKLFPKFGKLFAPLRIQSRYYSLVNADERN